MEMRGKIGNAPQLLKYAMRTISDSYGEGLEVIGFVASQRFLNDMSEYLKVENTTSPNNLFGLPLEVHPSIAMQPMVMAFITEPMSEDDARRTMHFYVNDEEVEQETLLIEGVTHDI
jgi:hypothetical protein